MSKLNSQPENDAGVLKEKLTKAYQEIEHLKSVITENNRLLRQNFEMGMVRMLARLDADRLSPEEQAERDLLLKMREAVLSSPLPEISSRTPGQGEPSAV